MMKYSGFAFLGRCHKVAAVIAVCSLCGLGLRADDDLFVVPEDTTYTLTTSATHGTNDIRGTIIVPSGLSISAYDNWFGRTGDAVINVAGGTYGSYVSTGSTPYRVIVGEDGGKATVNLTASGATFKSGDFTISASTPAHASGYVDFLTASPGSGKTANNTMQHRYNKTAHTARIQVLSGALVDEANGIGYYDARFQRGGPWLIEIAAGATYLFSRNYRSGAPLVENASLTVRGEGKVQCTAIGGDGAWAFNKGFVFENAGGFVFSSSSNKSTSFSSGVVFGDTFGEMSLENAQPVYFGGDFNLGSLKVTSTGRFMAASKTSPTITFGTADRDATLTGEVFAQDCGLKLAKTGSGALVASVTTPWLPELALDGGAFVIKGALVCSNLTMAAGTTVRVDGGTWTLDGNQLEAASGSAVEVLPGGAIIVKKVGDAYPKFAPGSTVNVLQYWIDGVRQPNGTYTLGQATLIVEELDMWTNAGKSGTTFNFDGAKTYKGFELVKQNAPLTFTGGPVTLSSAGISVEDTAQTAVFAFNLPLFAPVDQTWAFGNSSATFSQPFAQFGTTGGKVTITSTKDVAFSSSGSTFLGTFNVTASNITLSGRYPLGAGTALATLQCKVPGKIEFRNAELAQELNISNGRAEREYVRFYGSNQLQAMKWDEDGSNATYEPGSATVYNGNVNHYNWNAYAMGSGSRVVCKKPVTYWGYAGSSSCNFVPNNDAAVKPVLRYEAQNVVSDKASGGYGPLYYPMLYYGKSYRAGLRVELAADHAFSRGLFRVESGVEIDLCGYDNGMTLILGPAVIMSDAPAFLELDVPATSNNVVSCTFTGKAGLRMVGSGTATLTGASDSSGTIAVDRGTVVMKEPWPNAAGLSVAAGGQLIVTQDNAVPKSAEIALAGVGALAVRSPSGRLRVGMLTLKNPTTGEVEIYRAGEFDASNTGGLISEGSISVGKSGWVIIVY